MNPLNKTLSLTAFGRHMKEIIKWKRFGDGVYYFCKVKDFDV